MANRIDIGLTGNQHIAHYWLYPISHEEDVSCKLLSMGYLTIGWSAYRQSGIERKVTHRSDMDIFESMMKSFGQQENRSRWDLWHLCTLRKNDYVAVSLPNGEFSLFRPKSRAVPIGEIPALPDHFLSESGQAIHKGTDGLLYRTKTQKIVDLGFAIEVEPVGEHLSPHEYEQLTARMKIRPVNA